MTNEERRKLQRRRARMRRRQRDKRKRALRLLMRCVAVVAGIALAIFAGSKLAQLAKQGGYGPKAKESEAAHQKVIEEAPALQVELLTPNPNSRPQTALKEVKGIVIHYTANPGTTAMQNRNYFEGLKDSGATKASSHFIIGLEGEIIQCIPSTEISYASNERNADTLSIECCHMDETGEFTRETYDSLVELTAWLCGKFDLQVDSVIRHYDVTGKDCPRYFVRHEDKWEKFKEDVQSYLYTHGVDREE